MTQDQFNRKDEQFRYTEQLFWNDVKWGFRALLVISFLVALKFLGER